MNMTNNWRHKAACWGTYNPNFFPSGTRQKEDAQAICAGCPVAEECYRYARKRGTRYGVWGGRYLFRGDQTADHGTRANYQRGCRCDLCRIANNEYERTRRIEIGGIR